MKPGQIFLRIALMVAIYFGLKYYGGDVGRKLMFGISRLVTFLHEFGHAIGALITGGEVLAVQINEDGSGHTVTRGGSVSIILLGGYIGSAIFGNLLLWIGAKKESWAPAALMTVGTIMIAVGIVWYNSAFTTGLLFLFGIALILFGYKGFWRRELTMFLGLVCLLYIIEDFNVGPRSDLEKYAEIFVIIPSVMWMYLWLFVVIILSFFNLRLILRE